MLIYSDYTGERFSFAVQQLFLHYENEVRVTCDFQEFKAFTGYKLAYVNNDMGAQQFPIILATQWMWDERIHNRLPKVIVNEGLTQLIFDENVGFDVFASVFWMLSRYEEYISLKHDRHGRFVVAASVLGWDHDTDRPWVDLWRNWFAKFLIGFYPDLKFRKPELSLHVSIDVDSAFAYRHKGFLRTIGGMAKDVKSLRFSNLWLRFKCVVTGAHDPYDTYDMISSKCRKHKTPLIWFFLLADKSNEDIGLSYRSKALRDVINRLSAEFNTGIHPGYASNDHPQLLGKEKARLEEITGKQVVRSRQHYLRLSFPETYRRLIENGITHDYTMGFAERFGYRAGTNYPFPWFDLRKNEVTALTVHPFTVMDTTLRDYMKLSPVEAAEAVRNLYNASKETGGEFTILWHNESMSEIGKWKGWSKVFNQVIDHV